MGTLEHLICMERVGCGPPEVPRVHSRHQHRLRHALGQYGTDVECQGPPSRSPVPDIELVFFLCPVSFGPGNQVSTLWISVTCTWSQINSELSLGNGTNRKNMDERHIFASKIIPNGDLVDENDYYRIIL